MSTHGVLESVITNRLSVYCLRRCQDGLLSQNRMRRDYSKDSCQRRKNGAPAYKNIIVVQQKFEQLEMCRSGYDEASNSGILVGNALSLTKFKTLLGQIFWKLNLTVTFLVHILDTKKKLQIAELIKIIIFALIHRHILRTNRDAIIAFDSNEHLWLRSPFMLSYGCSEPTPGYIFVLNLSEPKIFLTPGF